MLLNAQSMLATAPPDLAANCRDPRGDWELDVQVITAADIECGCATDDGCSSTCASACTSAP